MTQEVPEALAKEVFLRLVEVQDEGISVGVSRQVIAKRFDLTEDQVKHVERAGLAGQWPPLT